MTHKQNTETGCLLVGDYVDDAENPPSHCMNPGEVVRPQLVANYQEDGGPEDGLKEFRVLLKDGRVAAVRGHILKHESHPVAGRDVFSIMIHTSTDEMLVAIFNSADVSGIFHGELLTNQLLE